MGASNMSGFIFHFSCASNLRRKAKSTKLTNIRRASETYDAVQERFKISEKIKWKISYLDQEKMNPKSRQTSSQFDILVLGVNFRCSHQTSVFCKNLFLHISNLHEAKRKKLFQAAKIEYQWKFIYFLLGRILRGKR